MKLKPIVERKFDILHPNNYVFWKIVIDDWNLDDISLSKWWWLQHRESIMAKGCYKEEQIMLGSHLVSSKIIKVGDTKHNV
jgi:hypothetical protein